MNPKQVSDYLDDLENQGSTLRINSLPVSMCSKDCSECQGTGYYSINALDTNGEPLGTNHWTFGKIFPCPNLPLESPMFDRSGLTLEERKRSWDAVIERENLGEALDAIKYTFEKKRGMVTLVGGVGLAKTLLLQIAVAEALKNSKGFISVYRRMFDILEEYKSTMKPQVYRSMSDIRDFYCHAPVLALDEIETPDTTFERKELFSLLDTRYRLGVDGTENVITLLATNFPLDKIDFRIADRVKQGWVIYLTGTSLRPGLSPQAETEDN